MKRALPGLLAACLATMASGCALFGEKTCTDIASAEAWINAMPSIGAPSPRPVMVAVKLADPAARATLTPGPQVDETTLLLHLQPQPGAPTPGRADYRGKPGDAVPERVAIRCGAARIYRIDRIERVQ